jgi:uncharacterized protein YodC (DUF2158 family)
MEGASMADFSVGDIVQLKSGGPLMTIKKIGEYSADKSGTLSAQCTWFDGKKPYSEVFPLHTLIKAD